MKQTASVKKNYLYNLVSQLVSFLIPLIITPYISRIFQADGIGIISFTTANVTYFTLFSMLGISGYGQRQVAVYRDDRAEVSKIFCELQLIHTVNFILTSAVYLVLIVTSGQYRIYYLANIVTLISCLLDINWFYQAYEQFGLISIRNCVVKGLMLAATFLFVHKKSDLIIYVLIVALANLLSNASLWAELRCYVDFPPIRSLNPKRHLKEVFVFFIPTIAASVYSILDKSVINWVTHEEVENGYYEQAYRVLTVANVLVQSLAGVAAPRMTYVLSAGKTEEFREKLNRSLELMLMVACPAAFGIAAIAPRFVPLFFGAGFEKTEQILYVFAPLVVVLGFSVYLDGLYLVPAGKRFESAKIICEGAALNLVLNLLMVIKWKAVGAAAATLITEGFIMLLMLRLSRQEIDARRVGKSLCRYGLISALMFIVVRVAGMWITGDFAACAVQIVSGAAVYGVALILCRDEAVKYVLSGFTGEFGKRK